MGTPEDGFTWKSTLYDYSHTVQMSSKPGSDDFGGGFFEEFVDQGLVGLGLLGGHAAELAEKFWGDADGDELLGVAGGGGGRKARKKQIPRPARNDNFLVGGALWPAALLVSGTVDQRGSAAAFAVVAAEDDIAGVGLG